MAHFGLQEIPGNTRTSLQCFDSLILTSVNSLVLVLRQRSNGH